MAKPPTLDIQFDRASKFYEPGEMVTGTVTVAGSATAIEYSGYTLIAEAYMDTVSAIRGNQGRPPLPVGDRISFMEKKEQFQTAGRFSQTEPMKF